jgi:hypothetical protein
LSEIKTTCLLEAATAEQEGRESGCIVETAVRNYRLKQKPVQCAECLPQKVSGFVFRAGQKSRLLQKDALSAVQG